MATLRTEDNPCVAAYGFRKLAIVFGMQLYFSVMHLQHNNNAQRSLPRHIQLICTSPFDLGLLVFLASRALLLLCPVPLPALPGANQS